MHITAFALTHPGLRRDANEDTLVSRPGIGLWAVCDGMGGHAAGEVASRVAGEAIAAFIDATDRVDARTFTWPFGLNPELGVDGTRLQAAFRLANHAIDVRVGDDPSLTGMATTAVVLLLADGAWRGGSDHSDPFIPGLVAHAGDSRAYLWREGQLTRLTRDHSWVEEQITAGLLSADDARHHPWRNMVTRALTGGPETRPDLAPVALEPGDRVLLCSDGLCGPVADDRIGDVLTRHASDVEGAAHTLVDAANAAGGPDNITVIIVGVDR